MAIREPSGSDSRSIANNSLQHTVGCAVLEAAQCQCGYVAIKSSPAPTPTFEET